MTKIETIIPHVGIDNIKFGMTPTEVAKIWSAPDSESSNFLKERIEYRNGVSTIYSTDNQLVEIGLARTCVNVRINGIFIFCPPKQERLRELLSMDNMAYEDVGMIAFQNLGISVTGFTHADDSDTAMSVFAPGRWDEDFETMKKYTE